MKKFGSLIILIFSSLILSSLNVQAESLPEDVLVEYSIHATFAPPAYRGRHRLQVLSDGIVQKIDNEDKKITLAQLSKAALNKLAVGIDNVKNDKLSRPDHPPCMDAPFLQIKIRQSDGANKVIWKRAGCLEYLPLDYNASRIADIVKGLQSAFFALDSLE